MLRVNESFEEFALLCGQAEHCTINPCSKKHCPRIYRATKWDTPLWRQQSEEGYTAFCLEHDRQFDILSKDAVWLKKIEEEHGIDALATLFKSRSWWRSKEGGWKNKRSRPAKTVDWRATYTKAAAMDFNQVKKQRGLI
jgi:hypothetical protein